MKKLMVGILLIMGMHLHANEITVHNMTEKPVTIMTARWKVLTEKTPLVLDGNSRVEINAGTLHTLERPSFKMGQERWLFATYAEDANTFFEYLKNSDREALKLLERNNTNGIDIAFGDNLYLVDSGENKVRISKKSPGAKKENIGQSLVRKGKELVAEVGTVVGKTVETVKEKVTPVIKKDFKDPIIESIQVKNPILIINGFSNPIYVRMYTKSNVGLIAINEHEQPIKIESNGFSFLQGPEVGSWFSRAPYSTLLVAQSADLLMRSKIFEQNPQGITPYTVYHNEILNISSNNVERFMMGKAIKIYNPVKTAASNVYGAIYVKDKDGDYIQASPCIELKVAIQPSDVNLILTPNEQGFWARIGFGRERILVAGDKNACKAYYSATEFPFGLDASIPLKGSEYVVWNDPKFGLLLKTEFGYRSRLSKVETWGLWIKNIFRKQATKKLIEELQEQ